MARPKKTDVNVEVSTNTDSQKSNKLKMLEHAIDDLEKKFGAGTVMKMGSRPAMAVETFSSGSIGLNIALGCGGYPRGRIIEIYGPESSGKTTLALHAVAEVQKNGGIAAYVDAEHAMDPVYARNIGVNIDEMYISQPDSGEQALEITENLARSGAVDLIVVDSVAALVPKAEIDGEMGDNHVGLQARLMSQALRKMTGIANSQKCTIIFINQLREKIGVMFGNPETTTGGRALKFYSTIRLDVRKKNPLKVAGEVVGNETHVKVVKNKVAPPMKEVDFDIVYGKGIDKGGEYLDIGETLGIFVKSGAWYSLASTGDKIGQGRDNAKAWVSVHPETWAQVDEAIKKHYTVDETVIDDVEDMGELPPDDEDLALPDDFDTL